MSFETELEALAGGYNIALEDLREELLRYVKRNSMRGSVWREPCVMIALKKALDECIEKLRH